MKKNKITFMLLLFVEVFIKLTGDMAGDTLLANVLKLKLYPFHKEYGLINS